MVCFSQPINLYKVKSGKYTDKENKEWWKYYICLY